MLMLALMAACGGGPAAADVVVEPAALEAAECDVCGMIVTEQPAPRGQALHRHGERAWFCSIGDMRAYMQAPNPRGEPVGAWVELMPASIEPASTDATARPWTTAADAHYVVGIERPLVMGRPALPLGSAADAQAVAERIGGHATSWQALQETPFHTDPDRSP
jgi:nitrous oxide reductase accessory protein NosL